MLFPTRWREMRETFSTELEDVAISLDALMVDIENTTDEKQRLTRTWLFQYLLEATHKRLVEMRRVR